MAESNTRREQTGGETADLQHLLRELDVRIERQRKRIERILITAPVVWPGKRKDGDAPLPRPAGEVAERALLAELVENRRVLREWIETLEAE